MKKITIIGSGSWGVALAIHLAKLGHKIKIWSLSYPNSSAILACAIRCLFLKKRQI